MLVYLKNKRSAFTLAEVLITLMIIGVVAMIVIPSTISKIKKHQTEVRLKTAYSILSNVISKAKADGYDANDLTNPPMDLTVIVPTYIKPYLSVSKDCGYYHTTHNASCFKAHWVNGRNFKGLNGSFCSGSECDLVYLYAMTLSNGMALGVSNKFGMLRFVVDINGDESPNKFGYDIFWFTLMRPGTGHCADTSAGWNYQYCNHGDRLYGTGWNYEFQENSGCSEVGFNCSGAILRNGWKIPDDYPAHF